MEHVIVTVTDGIWVKKKYFEISVRTYSVDSTIGKYNLPPF